MAPEVLNGKQYNHKADVWSLGIVFFELLTGFMPFKASTKDDLRNKLEQGEYKLPKKIKLSLNGLHFLNGCLQFDSSKRFSWTELMTHSYITNDFESQHEQIFLSYDVATGYYVCKE